MTQLRPNLGFLDYILIQIILYGWPILCLGFFILGYVQFGKGIISLEDFSYILLIVGVLGPTSTWVLWSSQLYSLKELSLNNYTQLNEEAYAYDK